MKIFVVYRDNDLFANHVPQLLEGFDVVDTFIVPQGTPFTDVHDDALAAADRALEAGAKAIIADDTCYGIANERGSWVESDVLKFERSAPLAYVFWEEINTWMPNNTVDDNFNWFAQRVVDGSEVKVVVVVRTCITDHTFAGTSEALIPDRVDWIAARTAALFPSSIFKAVNTLEEALEHADSSSTLLILDRHCGVKGIMDGPGHYDSIHNWPHTAMLYMLPFETCASHLISGGNSEFEFNLDNMRRILNERLYR